MSPAARAAAPAIATLRPARRLQSASHMKKTSPTKRPLRLATESVRDLSALDLQAAAGGVLKSVNCNTANCVSTLCQ